MEDHFNELMGGGDDLAVGVNAVRTVLERIIRVMPFKNVPRGEDPFKSYMDQGSNTADNINELRKRIGFLVSGLPDRGKARKKRPSKRVVYVKKEDPLIVSARAHTFHGKVRDAHCLLKKLAGPSLAVAETEEKARKAQKALKIRCVTKNKVDAEISKDFYVNVVYLGAKALDLHPWKQFAYVIDSEQLPAKEVKRVNCVICS